MELHASGFVPLLSYLGRHGATVARPVSEVTNIRHLLLLYRSRGVSEGAPRMSRSGVVMAVAGHALLKLDQVSYGSGWQPQEPGAGCSSKGSVSFRLDPDASLGGARLGAPSCGRRWLSRVRWRWGWRTGRLLRPRRGSGRHGCCCRCRPGSSRPWVVGCRESSVQRGSVSVASLLLRSSGSPVMGGTLAIASRGAAGCCTGANPYSGNRRTVPLRACALPRVEKNA